MTLLTPSERNIILTITISLALLMALIVGAVFGEEVDMERLIPAIARSESHNNPLAYNRHSKARGRFQITPIVLREYENDTKTKHASIKLFNPFFNKKVAIYYLNKIKNHYLPYYGLEVTVENIVLAWHIGPRDCYRYRRGLRGLGPRTKGFLRKVKKRYVKSPQTH